MSIQAKTPQLKNQYLTVYILSELVKQVCDCTLVPQNNIGDRPKYPFVSYKLITANQATTTDVTNQFSMTIQVDCHSGDPIDANNLAEDLRDALQNDGYRRFFKQANIVPTKITPTSDRTTLAYINYDQDFGFDVTFVVTGKNAVFNEENLDFTYSEIDIKSVHSSGVGADNTQISIDAKKGDN